MAQRSTAVAIWLFLNLMRSPGASAAKTENGDAGAGRGSKLIRRHPAQDDLWAGKVRTGVAEETKLAALHATEQEELGVLKQPSGGVPVQQTAVGAHIANLASPQATVSSTAAPEAANLPAAWPALTEALKGHAGLPDASTLAGLPGVPGMPGLQGHIGSSGFQGPPGSRGGVRQGQRGPHGPQGGHGDPGQPGPPGPPGVKGVPGNAADSTLMGEMMLAQATELAQSVDATTNTNEESSTFILAQMRMLEHTISTDTNKLREIEAALSAMKKKQALMREATQKFSERVSSAGDLAVQKNRTLSDTMVEMQHQESLYKQYNSTMQKANTTPQSSTPTPTIALKSSAAQQWRAAGLLLVVLSCRLGAL